MRVLVIGFPLPNPQFDNYNLLTAPSWFDYNAVVIDPASVTQVIDDVVNARQEHQTRADEPVLNRPTNPLAVGLADVVRRRRSETAQLLANGGMMVVFAQPNVVHEGVVGFPGCDRYAFMPAPAGLAYEPPFLARAEGTEIQPVDSTHAFAPLLDQYARRFAYRARFDEGVPGFSNAGRVIARSIGGAVVSVELKVGGGTAVFLPSFGGIAHGDQRFELANAMVDSLRRGLQTAADDKPPYWLSNFELPNLGVLEQQEKDAEQRVQEAEAELEAATSARTAVDKYRALLWQEGTRGLGPAVRAAFDLLGFELPHDPELPGWIEYSGVRALFEVEAAAGLVTEYPYFRLQTRLQKDLIDTKRPKRGLLVINGHHLMDPPSRPAQASETLRIAAENYRYAIVTTERLFQMVKLVMESPDDDPLKESFRRALLDTVGELPADVIPAGAPE